jgi:hypothetical protein
LTPPEYKAVRKRFLATMRDSARSSSFEIRILAMSEISEHDLSIHEHYALAATASVQQPAVKDLWSSAAGGLPTTVFHDPMRSTVAAAKYICKDIVRYQPGGGAFVYLFARNTVDIRWGSKNFWKG